MNKHQSPSAQVNSSILMPELHWCCNGDAAENIRFFYTIIANSNVRMIRYLSEISDISASKRLVYIILNEAVCTRLLTETKINELKLVN